MSCSPGRANGSSWKRCRKWQSSVPSRRSGRVELAARQAVVDEQQHAARERGRERREPAGEPEVDLRGVAIGPAAPHSRSMASHGIVERGGRRRLRPLEPPALPGRRRARAPPRRAATKRSTGMRVEHFVRDHHARRSRSGSRSSHSTRSSSRGTAAAQRRALALAQVGAHVEDAVAARQRVAPLRVPRSRSAAITPEPGAELEHVAAAERAQHLRALPGEAAAEHRRHFGRGDEVAARRRTCARRRCSSRGPARTAPSPCSARS